jgi:hypothetical protein
MFSRSFEVRAFFLRSCPPLFFLGLNSAEDRYGLILGLGVMFGTQFLAPISASCNKKIHSMRCSVSLVFPDMLRIVDTGSIGNRFDLIEVAVDEVVSLLQQLLHP